MEGRPVYLDLTKIRLPMSAFSSITHRLSGMYTFFITLPVILYLIYFSTSSKTNFDNLVSSISSISFFSFFIYVSLLVFWYHLLTGLRHLIMDFLHIGESLNTANNSAIFVHERFCNLEFTTLQFINCSFIRCLCNDIYFIF